MRIPALGRRAPSLDEPHPGSEDDQHRDEPGEADHRAHLTALDDEEGSRARRWGRTNAINRRNVALLTDRRAPSSAIVLCSTDHALIHSWGRPYKLK